MNNVRIAAAMYTIVHICDELEQAKFTPEEPYLRDKAIRAAFNLRSVVRKTEKEFQNA